MFPQFSNRKEREEWLRSLSVEQKVQEFNEMIQDSRCIAFLGGAGVSTESGIPDFRSKDGLYRRKDNRFHTYKPEDLLSIDCLERKSAIFFDYYRKNLDCRLAKPCAAHKKLAEMEQKGKLEGKADLVFHDSIGKVMEKIEI